MRIVHVSTGSAYPVQPTGAGGVEKAIFHLCWHLSASGHTVWVIDGSFTPRMTGGMQFADVWMPRLADRGIPRHLVRLGFFCAQLVFHIDHLARMGSIDVIHTHSQFSAGAVLAGRLLFGWDVRIVHTIHNPWILYEDFEHRYGTMVERWSLKHVDHVTVPTKDMQQIVVDKFGVSPSDVSRVHMGIDLDDVNVYLRQHPSDQRKGEIVLYTARISRRKNQLAILRAAPQVFAAYPEVQFVFCGPIDDHSYFRELHEFVQRCRLERIVMFTGAISKEKLYELYLGAKVFVFPSLVEVQSVALLEAIAFGLPVVASRIPANEEVLSAVGGQSVLVNPDEPAAIARAIIDLLGDGDSHTEGGPFRGDEPLTSFSWRSSAREMEAIYTRLLARR